MFTLLTVLNTIAFDLVLAASPGDKLANMLRDFIAPLFLLAVGIAALSFLFQRQVTQFLQFAALAVGIAVFFYFPGIIETLAGLISKAF